MLTYLVFFVVVAGFYAESKRTKTATWWPYCLWSRPAYRWIYRRTKSRMLAFFVTAIPGTLAVWAGVGLKAGIYHQIIVPSMYWLGFMRMKGLRK